MSNQRDRERDKRRYEKRQAQQAQRAAVVRRRQQVVGAVLAVLLVVGGGALLVHYVGGSDTTTATPGSTTPPASTPSPTGSPTEQPTSTPTGKYPTPPPTSLAAGATWTAKVSTSAGPITLELYGDKAPQTVSSFVFLSQQKFFDKTICHRLTTSGIYVLQCGDPTGSGSGGPGYQFGIENAPKDGKYPAGTLAMARANDPNSNGSQFFMVYKDTDLPTEGGGYSIFGKVTKGLDVLQAIAKTGVTGGGGDGAPAKKVTITGVTVEKQ